MRRRRQHRAVFALAGIYNLAWGGWVAFRPDALYGVMNVPAPSHPEVAACLGMVIGLYGIVYLEIARIPERGWVPAAVGLTGKLLGPIALAVHIAAGTWPLAAVPVVVFNDLIWWLPFARYLRDAWPQFHAEFRGSRTEDPTVSPRADRAEPGTNAFMLPSVPHHGGAGSDVRWGQGDDAAAVR